MDVGYMVNKQTQFLVDRDPWNQEAMRIQAAVRKAIKAKKKKKMSIPLDSI